MYEGFEYKGWKYYSEDEVFKKYYGTWLIRLPLAKVETKIRTYKSINYFFDVVDKQYTKLAENLYYAPDIPY